MMVLALNASSIYGGYLVWQIRNKTLLFWAAPSSVFLANTLKVCIVTGEQNSFCHNPEKLLPLYYHHENHLDIYAC